MEKRTVVFFKNTCRQCFNDVEIPLLGDFSYGEFEFQTADGKDFFVGTFIDNKTTEDVKEILKGKTYNLYSIMTQLADKKEGKGFVTMYPICPNCKGKMRYYTDSNRTVEKQIDYITWTDFQSKNEGDKKETILGLLYNS